MSDIAQLEQKILGEIAAAKDEPALEAVRVGALGKSGSITALLKTLGALTPEERKTQGPLINGLKDRVNAALGERRVFEGLAPRGERCGDAILEPVDQRALRLALLGRKRTECLQERRHRTVLAERCDPHRFEGRLVGGAGNFGQDLLFELCRVGHGFNPA